jgi:hypothetical protein
MQYVFCGQQTFFELSTGLTFIACVSLLTHDPAGCVLQQHTAKLLTLELKSGWQSQSSPLLLHDKS